MTGMTVGRVVASEIVRLHGSVLIAIHVVCGLAAGLVCGAYFAAAPYDPGLETDAFFQVLVLWLLGLLALALAALAYCLPMALAGGSGAPISAVALATLGMAGGSLCLYLFSIALALRFGRNATIAIGVLGTGISISSLGGLFNGLYGRTLSGVESTPGISQWIPFTWPTRFGSLGIEQALALTMPGGEGLRASIGVTAVDNLVPCLVLTLTLGLALLLWIGRFEDRRKVSD